MNQTLSYIWHNVWNAAFIVGVLGNLTAAIIWAVPAIRRLHKKLDNLHSKIDKVHEKVSNGNSIQQ